MPPYAKPNNQWLADTLRKQAAGVAANSAQQTNFIIDPTGKAWVIIGNLTYDNVGNATGIGSATAPLWGIAALDGSGAWQHLPSSSAYGRVTADIASTTSMADVTGLSFAISANEVWSYEFFLYVTSVGGTGANFQLTGPASPSSVLTALTGQHGGTSFAVTTVTAFSSSLGPLTLGPTGIVLLRGTIVNGANAGAVQLQYDDTVGAGNSTIKAGSYLLATKGA